MRKFYSNVWSVNRKSILYFGGTVAQIDTGSDSRVSEYIPATKAWNSLPTLGAAGPPPRIDHCAAANEDGTQMVVYGGQYDNSPVSGDIYVLNIATGEWVKGTAGPPRINTVCTIAGDQFLVWGGQDGTGALGAGAPMLIYNLTTAKWITNYIPPASYPKPSPSIAPTGAGPTSIPTPVAPEKPKNNLPPILGGVFGVLVLVLVIIGYILYRRRKQGKEREGKNAREKKMIISAPTMTDFDEPGEFRGPGYGPGVKEGFRAQTPYSKLAGPHGSIDSGRPLGGVDFDSVPGFNQPTSRSDPHTNSPGFNPPKSRSDPHTTSSRRGIDFDAVPGFNQLESRSDPHATTSPGGIDFDAIPGFNQPKPRFNPHATTSPKPVYLRGPKAIINKDLSEEEDEEEVFEKNLKSIEDQQRQLDLKRQLLVLQQQQGEQVTRSAPQEGSPVNSIPQHQQVRQVARLAPQEGSPVNSESGHWEMLVPASRGPEHVHGTTADFRPLPPSPPVKKSRVNYPLPPPTVQAYAPGTQFSSRDGYDYGGGYGYGDDNSPIPPTYRGRHNPQTPRGLGGLTGSGLRTFDRP
ncbi:hypothetical protein EC991_006921 [Linnemannia zychae]|nr:hypothetical protein EC991_006921 [Linnemannia zychae]